tara:strand:- start:482 stop:661 length:180 start_codon:yes stop_codon:yes gene_type:complete
MAERAKFFEAEAAKQKPKPVKKEKVREGDYICIYVYIYSGRYAHLPTYSDDYHYDYYNY